MEIIELQNEKSIAYMTENTKNKDKLYVIDCGATWCGPCKMFGKFYHEFVSKYQKTNHIVFCKLDVDVVPEFCVANEIDSVPTILFIRNSIVVARMEGASASEFKKKLAQCLDKNSSCTMTN